MNALRILVVEETPRTLQVIGSTLDRGECKVRDLPQYRRCMEMLSGGP